MGCGGSSWSCFGDPEWLKKQSAGELAVLHGVAVDKGIRLLEALEAGGGDAVADPAPQLGAEDASPILLLPGYGEVSDA